MHKAFVMRYEIMGTAYGWPVDVYVSKDAYSRAWSICFQHVEPGHEVTEDFTAIELADFSWIAGEKGMDIEAFAVALASSSQSELVELSQQLKNIVSRN